MVKSKLRIGFIIFFLVLIPVLSAIMLFGLLVVISVNVTVPVMALIFLLLLSFFTFLFFRDCKMITIDKKRGYLKWTSLFCMQGKITYLPDLIAYIRTEERSKFETRPVIHLVNKDRRISLKIHGLFCKNTEELVEALALPEESDFTENIFTGTVKLN